MRDLALAKPVDNKLPLVLLRKQLCDSTSILDMVFFMVLKSFYWLTFCNVMFFLIDN